MEKSPTVSEGDLFKAVISKFGVSDEVLIILNKVCNEYEYWDTIKYKKLPADCTPTQLWRLVKAERATTSVVAWKKYNVHFGLTNRMQNLCHEFDMNFGGSWESSAIIADEHKERYLISSLMEEAISSSQMEGAATTRKIAKEMLRKKMQPKDRSQQMIYNNYQTIRFIVENKKQALTADLLLKIHLLMTEKTLDTAENAGRFRQSDDVVVENGITHEVVHRPPSHTELPEFVSDLCAFFNNETPSVFIHPIIKGLILHFMVAYMHPFVDGNGRTARALFYWYMLKQGYWLTEYLSISRIIYKSKALYEKAFLYSETDQNDIGYFITYNLRVLDLAFKDLQLYIKRKIEERKMATIFLQIENINERQAEIIKIFHDNPKEMLTVKDLQFRFGITPTTAKSDLISLVKRGIVEEISLNKVKKGYIKGINFDEVVKERTV